jgi:Ca2+-binding EF-hand superfamily protein
MLRAF